MTRNGKIARLPWSLRDALNRRLRDGEPSTRLVDWLNSHGEVQRVLKEQFGGRPINEQNLCEWKQGGYDDWLQHKETRAWVQELSGQAEAIRQEIGDLSVADLVSVRVAIALARRLDSVSAKATADDPKQTKELLEIAHELARVRRDDHSRKCLAVQRERWEKEMEFKLLTLFSKGGKQPVSFPERLRRALVEMRADAVRKRHTERKKQGALSAAEEAHYQKVLARLDRWRNCPAEARANEHVLVAGVGSSDPEPFNNQNESNSIKPAPGLVRTEPVRKFPVKAIWRNKDHDKPVTLTGIAGEKEGEIYYQSEGGTGIPLSQLDFDAQQ